MSMGTIEGKERRFTGYHMLAAMVAFFGVVIGVNFWLAYEAETSWTGLMAKNGYVPSQQFNTELAEARVQKERGWRSALSYRNGALELTLVDSSGGGIVLDNVTAELGRPAFDGQDRKLALTHRGRGVYAAMVDLPLGAWDVRIDGGDGGRKFRRESRMIISAGTGREK
jgi:nitrogen fixation protein FixH